jgi:putative ABC transport system ATP-binding protein
VFQRPADNLIPHLSVSGHLRLAARLRRAARRTDVDAMLEELGLGSLASRVPEELSGGEQQRLAFAQAIVGDPSIVIADEPTAELDSATAEGTLGLAASLARRGTAVVVATHDPAVLRVADRTLYLRHGAMEAERHEDRRLSVIDASGRIQLPPEALRMFPGRRAVMTIGDGRLELEPP